MKKFARLSAFVIAGIVGLSSCEESSLVPDDQRDRDERNVQVYVLPYWGGSSFVSDSVYAFSGGTMTIDRIRMVFSDYEFSLSTGDTVNADESFGVVDISSSIHKIGLLPAGVYTGEHQIKIGYDSAGYYMPHALAPGELLASGIRRNNVGYNHLVVEGKYRLEDDTVNTMPFMPFEYRLGGEEFNLQFEVPMSFSVTANNPISLIYNFQVDMLFNAGLTPIAIDQIMSDPNNNTDYLAAQVLFANFESSISPD